MRGWTPELKCFQEPRQFANRFDHGVGRRATKPLGHRRSAEHTDGAHSRAMRHLDVLRRIAHVHAHFGRQAEPLERQSQRGGMRFSVRGILAANFCTKQGRHLVLTQLPAHSRAASARYQRQRELPLERAKCAPRSSLQFRPVRAVKLHPQTIGLLPFRSRKAGGAIYPVPVGRIAALQLRNAPGQSQCRKHIDIGLRVRLKGIQQGSIPVEQHALSHGFSAGGRLLQAVRACGCGGSFPFLHFRRNQNSTPRRGSRSERQIFV